MAWTIIKESDKDALVKDILDIMEQAKDKWGDTEVPHTTIITSLRGAMMAQYQLKSNHRWRGFTNSLDYQDKSYNQEEFLTEVAGLKMRRVRRADGCILKTLYSL